MRVLLKAAHLRLGVSCRLLLCQLACIRLSWDPSHIILLRWVLHAASQRAASDAQLLQSPAVAACLHQDMTSCNVLHNLLLSSGKEGEESDA